ncbi:hypothetical protein AAG570_004775 [Ranatra chinensis]|uniref:Uncharacterized protein n=1 Tax=Ranatra chinensis TaxID=642074 RepID=A0ABD0YNN5_9HEMI
MVSLYEDFWQEIVYWPLRALKAFLFRKRQATPSGRPKFEIPSIDDISFHLTMIMLWALPTLVSIPSVLFWGRNYRYSVKLENDPFFINGIIMSACGGLLWQGDLPRPNLPLSRQVSRLVFASSVLVLVYGQTSIYRMSWIVVGVICVVTAHQTFGHLLASDHRDSPDEDVGILQHIRKVLLATSDSATNLDGKDFTPNDSEGEVIRKI